MEVTSGPVEWDMAEDREMLRQFLQTRTGQRLIPKVLESCPTLLPGGDPNAIMIRSGEVRGVQITISALLSLSVPEPKVQDAPNSAYPPLDDDTAWADGKTVNTPPQ